VNVPDHHRRETDDLGSIIASSWLDPVRPLHDTAAGSRHAAG
jgi:hypothetical protein